ncbi:MAG: NAD(P)H-dependent oxidoreductase subunit E [Deltaproteobacteria bacterium]|nr:NAD(P)H-dependent oxidoreductase subunit E [Deltaproteobacteria bacterium]
MKKAQLEKILKRYDYLDSNLLAILQDVQVEENYLSREALEGVAERLVIPLARVYKLATFYRAFSLTPRGRHLINVCLGTACHVRGATKVLERLERDLGVEAGGTTKDLGFTLDTVRCIGCCSLGPVVVIDGEIFGKLNQGKAAKLLKEYN